MERVTQKVSTILVSVGDRTECFRSVAEMPPSLRKKLLESTSGHLSATLLIADERGRKEILKSIQQSANGFESKILDSITRQYLGMRRMRYAFSWRQAGEIALIGGIGLCLWLLAAWR